VDESSSDLELFAAAAELLNKLPNSPDLPREAKWRTVDQLANELGLSGSEAFDRLDRVLRAHETRSLERLAKAEDAGALIRRAKYPDKTTALPLWGGVKPHGPPWKGYRPDRSDVPDDLPPALWVRDDAPQVFLSHAHQDTALAFEVAGWLAKKGIGSWMAETKIEQRKDIAECVRGAIADAAGFVVLVTRHSIASLWVMTEGQNCARAGRTMIVIVDARDPLLLELLQSLRFNAPGGPLDASVSYADHVLLQLKEAYRRIPVSQTRIDQYCVRAHDFLGTLPSYLRSVANGPWRPALAFPEMPINWSGPIALEPIEELPSRLAENCRSD